MQSLTQTLTVTLIVSFALVYLMVPYLRKLALKTGFVDMPNPRKLHKEPIPVLGGAALYFGFIITVFLVQLFNGGIDTTFYGIAIGGFLLFGIGLVDDYYKTRGKDFPAWPKLLTHILAA